MHTNHGPPYIYLTLYLVVLLSFATCLVSPNLYGANESEQGLPLKVAKIDKSYFGKIIKVRKLHSFGNMMATYYTFFLKNYMQVADNSKSAVTPINDPNTIFVPQKATGQLDTLEKGVVESKSEVVSLETGIASWYGLKLHGKVTASGEVGDMNELTAAHKNLPFNTLVRVTNLKNGNSVIVRINDRGPFIKGRIIDLSKEAARQLNMIYPGISEVKLEILSSDS
jgi:hypothetical protein